ncbi:MAG: hypothetical protein RLZZ127_730 [Planctomycetota bacterium]|jgi:RNA polymerase sigma-70 factor (ECF subfamily)
MDPDQGAVADLAAWADRGDRAALDRVLAWAAPRAWAQAVRLLPPCDAEDACQEAAVLLIRDARRHDRSRPLGPWWAVIVHRACLRVLRRRRATVPADPALPAPDPGPGVDAALVRRLVAALPEHERAAVALHYFGLCSEISG